MTVQYSDLRFFRYLLDKLPENKQLVAFSATFDETLYDILQAHMNNPQKVVLTTDVPVLEGLCGYPPSCIRRLWLNHLLLTLGVQQYFLPVNIEDVDSVLMQIHVYEQKSKAVVELLEKIPFYQCIIFLNHRGRAADLTQYLNRNGWMSCHISSGINQQQRLDVMEKARKFRIRVLVCSDLVRTKVVY